MAQEKISALMQTGLFVKIDIPHKEKSTKNRVYIENGEVKTDIVTDSIGVEEMRRLLHEMVDLEYTLP